MQPTSNERRFTGVAFNKKAQKWKARYCRSDGKRMWLPELFDSDEAAAKAYDTAVLRDGLPAQPLNFATHPEPGQPKKVSVPAKSKKVAKSGSIAALQQQVKQAKTKGVKTSPAAAAAASAAAAAGGGHLPVIHAGRGDRQFGGGRLLR